MKHKTANSVKKKLFGQKTLQKRFEAVYNQHFDKLYTYAKIITKSEEMAKDIVADVFFYLWKRQPDFTSIKELDAYLFISVKNLSIRAVAKKTKRAVSLNRHHATQWIEELNPEKLLLEKELMEVMDGAIDTLPDQCQLVFDLVKGKHLKYSEVANELGISEGTVKNHIIKALNRIRNRVTAYLEQDQQPMYERSAYLGLLAVFFTKIIDLI
ncbi:RNA polymerase sigma-70 factor [Rapidithrix thailandica]|uniref:RNA polymerase sigma-70 factor n=1 Tax=Rapidithrix thailandica TaxID=413964 RepID=A0AAW9SHF6_9BACT